MSTFPVTITIARRDNGGPTETVEGLVGTGASYTKVPRPLLEALGIRPELTRRARLADGRTVVRELAQVLIQIRGIPAVRDEAIVNLVSFGEAGEDPLLGALTLESFSLTVDPLGERLILRDALEL